MALPADHGPLAFIGAMSSEIKTLEGQLADRREETFEGWRFAIGKFGGKPAVVMSTGMGKVNAACGTTLLLEHYKPTAVIMVGIAGGIDPSLRPGDVVIGATSTQWDYGSVSTSGSRVRGAVDPIHDHPDPVAFPADAKLLDLARQIKPDADFGVLFGVIATGDTFIASADKRQELQNTVHAASVDNESGAVAQVCWQQGVPFIAVRGISDSADAQAGSSIRENGARATDHASWVTARLAERYLSPETSSASTKSH
jgi:adenosylhomocysteine nucleosidase